MTEHASPDPTLTTRRPHHCHARGCTTPVPPKLFMCARHWFLVPKALRDAMWANYSPEQERRKNPTIAWHKAADAAIKAVWEKEHPRD